MIFLLVPLGLGEFGKVLLTEVLIWAIFAMAFDLVYGYTGMLNFAQATFFGLGSYALTLSILHWEAGLFLAIAMGVIVATAVACLIGYLAVRVSGVHFAILTIIFALVIFYLGLNWRWLTGGDDGLSLKLPELRVADSVLSLYDPITNYYFVFCFFALCYVLMRRITESPLGKVFVSIRENEDRARLVGYNVERYKLVVFVIAAAFCGLAGGLYSLTTRFANVRLLHWTVTSDAMIWTIVGGAGTLHGPVLGTALLISLTDYISSWFVNHRIITGAVMVFFVVAAPRGIIGFIRRQLERRRPGLVEG
ncbi:MAG: branched-chain amino acid ABC transporter permease [Candidatus Rokubacteria bacterium]|nr:branched-chain amino acid ABC transporter permease [Candidatus Rokubacteria bacterium]